ncbi:MAG TPA: hypothetical protein VFB62_06775 [Polyangiaceae bacterium]|nr:hypothetical protein [Polyangiaceae bacterium]
MRSWGYAVVGLQACFFASDFTGLDDGSGSAAQTNGQGGSAQASTASSSSGQGGMGGATSDGGSFGGAPDCKLALATCNDASECCGDLGCMTNESSKQQTVCCGMALEPCFTMNGADCCGQLWCDFTISSPAEKICCGAQGDPCTLAGGEDCCGSLQCINDQCVP